MKNDDLIAFLEPVSNRFRTAEWRDATGTIEDVSGDAEKLMIRTGLPAGIYRGAIVTREGAFEMQSAMIGMTRAPDGACVPFGPWDLNHLENVMAVPMALVTVNRRFRGGLWFSMPGPEKIAAGVLTADFGFEHEGGELELTLELSPRDRNRFSWNAVKSLELRRDDRNALEWKPLASRRPRFFTAGLEREALAQKLRAHEGFAAAGELLEAPVEEWKLYHGQNDGVFDLACLIGYATGDQEILSKAKRALLTLCETRSWSGRPDPLLIGGDNDRGIGFRLSVVGVGWEFLRDFLSDGERETVRSKAEEYLGKMTDFTLLQRGYMGCPTPDEHSLGTWWGVGIACMAFYDELAIARKALRFFHALMVKGLGMFSSSGKEPWATYQPIWPARYFAAAIEFGGRIREVDESPFLDHLAQALLTCFRSPNTQEMQRGLRTVEHRVLTAFLNAFHPTPGVPAIYRAFVEEERRQAGKVCWGMFDLLYGPTEPVEPAAFPEAPLFSRDTGDVIATIGPRRVNIQINGGNQTGMRNSFRLQPHNRERARSMGDFILSVDGDPVLTRILGSYGIFSAQRNALCFEEGCLEGEGQYLHGDIPPERSSFLRRFCLGERFVYADVNLTRALDQKLHIHYAQRAFLLDRKTGVILIHDAWKAAGPLRVGTHLHCCGRITDEGGGCYRLTGGQANTIAGIKFGDAGLADEERGEIYAQVLDVSGDWRVRTEEPYWFPSYIYGLNGAAGQKFEDARYPKQQRWRLELTERAREGHIVFALTPGKEPIVMREGLAILPEGAVYDSGGEAAGEHWSCSAEAVAHDRQGGRVMAAGATRWTSGDREIRFRVPVDLRFDEATKAGVIHSPTADPAASVSGFRIEAPVRVANSPRSLLTTELSFHSI